MSNPTRTIRPPRTIRTRRAPRAPRLAALLLLAAGVGVTLVLARPGAAQAVVYEDLWAAGVAYDDFLAGADGRRELWERNSARAAVAGPLLERARAVGGRWRLLVVASARCSDSVSTLPYLAALAAGVEGLELRIISPEAGRAVLAAHRTADGRGATPTVVVLDRQGAPAGVWIERPAALRAWLAAEEGLSHDQLYDRKMGWYDEDAGGSAVREIVELLESPQSIPTGGPSSYSRSSSGA